jgi:hypothetical protein
MLFDEDDLGDTFGSGGLNKEKIMMFLKANKDAAETMSLEKINVVVTEGTYRLCSALSERIDTMIMESDGEEFSDVAKSESGRIILHAVMTLADAMVMIMESIAYLKDNFPDYQSNLDEFHKEIMDRIKDQEEKLVKEFVDSIPDSIDLE